jgi:hypothetical protein
VLPRCPFLTNAFSVSKSCPSRLETVGLRVPNQNFREVNLFNVAFKRRNCPFPANVIGNDSDIFNGFSVKLNDWLVYDVYTA